MPGCSCALRCAGRAHPRKTGHRPTRPMAGDSRPRSSCNSLFDWSRLVCQRFKVKFRVTGLLQHRQCASCQQLAREHMVLRPVDAVDGDELLITEVKERELAVFERAA